MTKPPKPCDCHVHADPGYRICSRDARLIRRCRQDSLAQAAKMRSLAATEQDPRELAWLERVAICAEWSAWAGLLRLRELKHDAELAAFIQEARSTGKAIDHINGDISDNRLENLRVVTLQENKR